MALNRFAFSCVLLSVTVAISGCGGSDRPALAHASGKVTLDGAPVEGATVTFVPEEGGRPATAITNAEGIYEMNSYSDAKGAKVGSHLVSVMKVGGKGADMLAAEAVPDPLANGGDESATGDDSLSPNMGGVDGPSDKKVDIDSLTDYLVPKKYMNADSSGLKVTVPEEGSESLDVPLQS